MPKTSSNSQTQMPSSPSSAGTPEPEKSQQPRPSAIIVSILTRMGSERARPRATSRSTASSGASLPMLFSAHNVSLGTPAGLRPLMKALASGTSVAAALAAAVSPQQPEPPQHPDAS